MKRYRKTTIHVDPEVKEFALLNSKIEDNRKRDKAAAANMYVLLRLHERVRLVEAKERHRKSTERKRLTLMNKLADRVVLLLLLILGVYFLWDGGLLGIKALHCVSVSAVCLIAFLFGATWSKYSSEGGDK